MPDPSLENFQLTASNYGFSGTRLEDLDASEYTLVTICQDDSSSVDQFKNEMESTLKKIVEACKKSPRADNLMIRFCTFNSAFNEVHGFKRLQQIKPSDYDGVLGHGGTTALYDAAVNAVESSNLYAKKLTENDFSVNAITFFITDGADNESKTSAHQVKQVLQSAMKDEVLESIVSILVGVNADGSLDQYLQHFKDEAGITQYVGIGDATAGKLAKLAEFVSRSISAQSQALGTGGPSQSLSF